jgi:two-component system, chemotaxis family, chemotaxis protein CheY
MLALIVDDSRAMRMVLRRTVEHLGFRVVEADNGQVALDLLNAMETTPDLAMVDWNMPVMDGLEFVTAVHAEPRWRSMTVMMVTTEGEQSRVIRALTAGAHEYVMKPFTPDSIVDKLALHGLPHPAPAG